jgi:hypothetical protein
VHKELQRLACTVGEKAGFRATTEHEILNGAGRVDVALLRADEGIAVEVVVTSTSEQVTVAVTRALAAGFSRVVVLSRDRESLRGVETHVTERLVAKDRARVHFLNPDGFRALLDELSPAEPVTGRVAGYLVEVVEEEVELAALQARRHCLACLVGTALLRARVPL